MGLFHKAQVFVRNLAFANDVGGACVFDNAASEVSSHAKYGELNLDFAASVTSVPYHPGAAKYFAEKGYTVATK